MRRKGNTSEVRLLVFEDEVVIPSNRHRIKAVQSGLVTQIILQEYTMHLCG